ncbi:hypothetical protein [Actinospica robiniae]|uniref:hypothetical protein n=1 Tax=Actinospica robiniae TaxID=304901 RepID=UPI0012FC2210|nr:hypothetical protein [Actinospica robiniae]
MTDRKWFIPDPEESADMTAQELAFAAALSEATAGLVTPGVSDLLIPAAEGDHGDDTLVASLSFSDRDTGKKYGVGLIDFGVHFCAGSVKGGRLHNQLYSLTGATPSLALEASGTIDELADQTARWFDAVLRRPIVLYVWLNDGYAYAARYAFADTSETLAQLYNRGIAPKGQYEQVIAAGHVHGRGWLQTAGLPTPDVYVPIRGDLAAARVPAAVVRAEQRGPIDGSWYE